MNVIFGDQVAEVFDDLPLPVKRKAAGIIDLIAVFPAMFPLRRRGLMRGYRYFAAFDYLFYYSVTSSEVRISAIIPPRRSPQNRPLMVT